MCSPLHQGLQDAVQVRVLRLEPLDHCLDCRIALSLLLEDLLGLLLRHLTGKALRGHVVEARAQQGQFGVLKALLAGFEAAGEQLELAGLELVAGLLVFLLFLVDVARNVGDFPAALLHRGVQLHLVVRRVLQRLLQVRDLAGQLALGS